MSASERQPSEEELRAAYEAEIKRIRVEHLLIEHVVTLANLGMRRTGLAPGTEGERDPDQVRVAIEAIRAVMPLLEQCAPGQIGAIRDALSQLQLAFVRIGGEPATAAAGDEAAGGPAGTSGGEPAERPAGASGGEPGQGPAAADEPSEPEPPGPKPGEPGPAQRSGRLWVPGQ
jgi:hypothetical protein